MINKLMAWTVIIFIIVSVLDTFFSKAVPLHIKLLVLLLLILINGILKYYPKPKEKPVDPYSINIKGDADYALRKLIQKYSNGKSERTDMLLWVKALEGVRQMSKSLCDRDFINSAEEIFGYFLRKHELFSSIELSSYYKGLMQKISNDADIISGRTVLVDRSNEITFIVASPDDIAALKSKYVNSNDYIQKLQNDYSTNTNFKKYDHYSNVKLLASESSNVQMPVRYKPYDDNDFVVQAI